MSLTVSRNILSRHFVKLPRDHQVAATEAVLKALQENDRAQCIMACGTGKTFVGQMIAKEISGRTLLLEPSINLISQNFQAWINNYRGKPPPFMIVCSDDTANRKKDDTSIESLNELRVVVTNDPSKISRFLSDNPKGVIVSTYQSLRLIKEAQSQSGMIIDCIISDEAHRTAGLSTSEFSLVHNEQLIKSKKRVFLTATPRIISGNEEEVFSMSNPKIFGPVAYNLPFSKAIEMGLLCDYQLIVVGVKEDDLIRDMGDGTSQGQRYALAELAIKRALDDFNLKKIITFHGNVAKARDAATNLQKSLDRNAYVSTIDGSMPSRERNLLISSFSSNTSPSIITNCRCLTEGVDIPAVDAIVFVDPKKSEVDIVQAVGRAIRPSSSTGKQIGTILVPLLVPNHADPEVFISSSSFKAIIQVLRALRAHDDRIEQKFRKIAEGPQITPQEVIMRDPHIRLEFPQLVSKLRDKIVLKICEVASGHKYNEFSEDRIQAWALAYREKFGTLPTTLSTNEIPGFPGYTGQIIDIHGRLGTRGLGKGRSLAKILLPLKKELGLYKEMSLNLRAIQIAALEFHKIHGKWPTNETKLEVPGMPNETWTAMNTAGWTGARGLTKGQTLSAIIKPLRNRLKAELKMKKSLS